MPCGKIQGEYRSEGVVIFNGARCASAPQRGVILSPLRRILAICLYEKIAEPSISAAGG